jgi:predicted nucleic acid-binding protein
MSTKRVTVVVDSSVLIQHLFREVAAVQSAIDEGRLVLSPLVVAELLSGDLTLAQREIIGEILQDFPLHPTPLGHWIDLGNLRRMLRSQGINATIPDAHVAQCAIDLDAVLLTRDDVFLRIAAHTTLRLDQLR